tara:strand:+ start:573 stop:767 length:195 start_codon:yes stop_codon:yes gene_type:complete
VGLGKSVFTVQLFVSGSNSPEQNKLKGFSSLKEYSLQLEILIIVINIKNIFISILIIYSFDALH